MNFYGIVVSIAVVLLIIILTYIGLTLKNKNGNKVTFPPVESKCPDYWEYTGNACVVPEKDAINTGSVYDANGVLLLNTVSTFGLTTGNSISGTTSYSNYIDFNNAAWNSLGLTSVCQKQKWASMYGIQWDGVSNYNGC
jgi:hypothetical protein